MERFVSEQNVNRYRQLASGTLTAAGRKAVFTMLSEEEATYRNLPKPGIPVSECPDRSR
jgi:hypothetical protein